jgi:hypothetical protein
MPITVGFGGLGVARMAIRFAFEELAVGCSSWKGAKGEMQGGGRLIERALVSTFAWDGTGREAHDGKLWRLPVTHSSS